MGFILNLFKIFSINNLESHYDNPLKDANATQRTINSTASIRPRPAAITVQNTQASPVITTRTLPANYITQAQLQLNNQQNAHYLARGKLY